MNEFLGEAFNTSYSTEPLVFQEAESQHFSCHFSYREEDTLFQFLPRVKPIREDFVRKVSDILSDLIGEERFSECVIEYIEDDLLEGGHSVYVRVPGFTSETYSSSKLLTEKLLTEFHDSLS